MRSQKAQLNRRRGWLSFYALMIVVILGFYIAGTQISSIDQSQSYRLRVFEAQAMQAADAALAYALRDTASNAGQWLNMSAPGDPNIPRADTIAIWTGNTGNAATSNKMIVWGGRDKTGTLTNFGGIYDPQTDTWAIINDAAGAPVARTNHTVTLAGTKLIVWGGLDGSSDYLNTGGVYDLTTQTWSDTNIDKAPAGRSDHKAVWTGSEMIIWGGRDGTGPNDKLDDGKRYDPANNSWSNISSLNAPSKRASHSAVWTGSEMIVWGGEGAKPPQPVNTGARYNPVSNSWQPMNTINAPSQRAFCSTIWTGNEMIVWGGYKNPSPQALGDGGIYSPVLDDMSFEPWRQIASDAEVPTRRDNAAVWIDGTMALWGGMSKPAGGGPNQAVNSGCALRPECGHWGLITETGAPGARHSMAAVWTGSEMIIWGGRDNSDAIIDDGKRWQPPQEASNTYELTIDSAMIQAASLTYEMSSQTPALVTVTSCVLDRNGRTVGARTARRCLDVERHRYNKGCWTRP